MKYKSRVLVAVITTAMLVLLIYDTKTAVAGTAEGIALCTKVLLPSLFPFILVTTCLNAALTGLTLPGLGALTRALMIPEGGETLLLLGLLGGYPVGAQLIADAYKDNQLNKRTAQILMGYCSNAGPAFIFGVIGTLFPFSWISLLLWGIHISAALATGFLLPRPENCSVTAINGSNVSIVSALKKTMTVSASICGWVIVFRIIIEYMNVWLLGRIGSTEMAILSGLLELSNGSVQTKNIDNDAVRFILSSAFLAFGGLCIMLQTASVSEGLGLGMYIPGKLMQTALSTLMATVLVHFIFPAGSVSMPQSALCIIACVLTLISIKYYVEKKYGNFMANHI